MTPQEVKLWVQLKCLNRQGFHFRRQVPIDSYIVDFAEFGQRLIIWNYEVDQNMDGVMDAVLAALPHPALRATFPARGKDKWR
jgi:very-short-patch-repair endonuclease